MGLSANDEKLEVGRLNSHLALQDCATDGILFMQCHKYHLPALTTSANPSASGGYLLHGPLCSVFTRSNLRAGPAVAFVSGRLDPAISW